MKIQVNKNACCECLFKDIKVGEVFQYSGEYFIKINHLIGEKKNAFCLNNNKLYEMDEDGEAIPCLSVLEIVDPSTKGDWE